MSIDSAKKTELIKKHAVKEGDTGSPEVQCAILTTRIANLTKHFQTHKKDFNSRRGLLVLIGRRKRLLNFLRKKDESRYVKLIKNLGVRK